MKLLNFLFTMASLIAMPQHMKADGVAINSISFPDPIFRNYVLENCDNNRDKILSVEEIEDVTVIWVNNQGIVDLTGIEYFTALEGLYCPENQLTKLDLSKNPLVTLLDCHGNRLTTLDVSKNTEMNFLECSDNQLATLDVARNTALTHLSCYNNKIISLDVSKNTALNYLVCSGNRMITLDVSKNTKLNLLYCGENQLTAINLPQSLSQLACSGNLLSTLDVSKCICLSVLDCSDNQLNSLDVSKNFMLQLLDCSVNRINGINMDALIAGLSKVLSENGKYFRAINLDSSYEHNVVTKAQVAAAKEKGWTTTYYYDIEQQKWYEYEGSDSEFFPVGFGRIISIANEIDENTNLDGSIVGNVYYSISSGDGHYNSAEGCLVVTKPTDDSAIDGKDIFGDDFKDNYTGIVFKVNEGKGSIKVEAETQGNMVLKVKIGNNDPIEMELDGKLKVKFPYNVNEETLVYIYGGMSTAGAKATGGTRASADADLLKIYGFEVVSDASGIDAIENGLPANADAPVYNLNGQRVDTPTKGIYIKNGRKVLVK